MTEVNGTSSLSFFRNIPLSFFVSVTSRIPPCLLCFVSRESELPASKREMALIAEIFRSLSNLSVKYTTRSHRTYSLHRIKRGELGDKRLKILVRETICTRIFLQSEKFAETFKKSGKRERFFGRKKEEINNRFQEFRHFLKIKYNSWNYFCFFFFFINVRLSLLIRNFYTYLYTYFFFF